MILFLQVYGIVGIILSVCIVSVAYQAVKSGLVELPKDTVKKAGGETAFWILSYIAVGSMWPLFVFIYLKESNKDNF